MTVMTLIVIVLLGVLLAQTWLHARSVDALQTQLAQHTRTASRQAGETAATIATSVAEGISQAVTLIEHGPVRVVDPLDMAREMNSGDHGDPGDPAKLDLDDPSDAFLPDPAWLREDVARVESFATAEFTGIPGFTADLPPVGERFS